MMITMPRLPKLQSYKPVNRVANIERAIELARQHQAQAEHESSLQRLNQNPYPQTYLQSVYGTPFFMGASSSSPYGSFAMDNPINFSTPNTPTAPPGKVINTYEMRSVARYYDVMRACISHLKREVAAVPLNIIPRDKKDTSKTTEKQIDFANAFLRSDGGLGGYGTRRTNFESEMLEDLLVLGCSAIQYIPTKGGQIDQVVNLASETIRPVVDGFGWPPDATDPKYDVYEQWILGLKVTGFKRNELRYDGLYPVTWSPFFDSPVEYLLANANSYIRAQGWNLSWLTDGTSNDEYLKIDAAAFPTIGPGSEQSPDQVAMWLTLLLAANRGDSRNRHIMKALPPGSSIDRDERAKDWDFEKFMLYCAQTCAAIYGVQLSALGYPGQKYQSSEEASMEQTTLFGAGVLFDFRKAFYDDLWERMGMYDIETVNEFIKEENQLAKAQVQEILHRSGLRTANELRTIDGVDPYPDGMNGNVPLIQNTLVPMSDAGMNTEAARAGADDSGSGNSTTSKQEVGKPASKVTKPKGGPDEDTPDEITKGIEADLKRWAKKSYQRLRDGKGAACNFASESIPDPLARMVTMMLIPCKTSDEVYRVFGLALNMVEQESSASVVRSEPSLTGGEWKTVNGSHVYIKDGVAIAGNAHVLSAIEKKGMHAATDDERKIYKVRPDLADVHIADDLSAATTFKGKDVKGKTQSGQSDAAKQMAAKEKFDRVQRLHSKIEDVDKKLLSEITGNGKNKEEALVLRLLHRSGIRIGNSSETGAAVKAYGASTLKQEHVTVDGDIIHLDFPGKHGVQNKRSFTDPVLAKEINARQKSGDPLFKTNGTKTIDYLNQVSNDNFKNHDLRTLHGTVAARKIIEDIELPKTVKEFNAKRKEAGAQVGKLLNNSATMALGNYIDPRVFDQWKQGVAH